MVMGTDFVLTGSYSWTSFVASLVPFFLVSDLLLLNQFPDVEADKWVGRKASAKVYVVFLAATYMAIILGYISGTLPLEGFLALASIVLAVPTVRGVTRYADDIPSLIR
jgi:1,4-dihydroxy-2-naphthoate octaprenyltransferase